MTQALRRDPGSHDLFCIRLHFVLKERIGVEKISATRVLMMDEGARDLFANGANEKTTANTMLISQHARPDTQILPRVPDARR
ncbi:hypothetical protein [Bradyrhizobium sp. McL0616]|uniref:hypothetical protein n=1 Tax=Bradyrhizobium sp. McL0616 TaxID=3415674 RepID=UPI003CF373EC